MQKLGSIASFLIPIALIGAGVVYLTGNLGEPLGPLKYALADFLAGPLFAASLVASMLATREHIGPKAKTRMDMATLAAVLAGAAMVAVALIRSSNRGYYLHHSELQLHTMTPVMVVWTTLVAGLTTTGWHFLGWALVLTGSAGWTTERLPRLLSGLYVVVGATLLFAYVLPEDGDLLFPFIFLSMWHGIVLLKAARTKRRRR